jgi:uncharacterized protein (DUF1800 family)
LKIESVIAANRFGLGARPGELSRIDGNPRGWLLGQLAGPSRVPEDIRTLPDSASVLTEVQEVRKMQREAKRTGADQPAPDVVQKFGSIVRRHYIAQTGARFRTAADTDYPFHERLVHLPVAGRRATPGNDHLSR